MNSVFILAHILMYYSPLEALSKLSPAVNQLCWKCTDLKLSGQHKESYFTLTLLKVIQLTLQYLSV